MATSKKKVLVYLPEDTKLALERLASQQKRSMSNYIETLIDKEIATSDGH